jgi:uncharacterized lipoprotein NlpE involved in copper resistance
MKKCRIAMSLIALVLLVGVLSGCDNRSQLEKDVDAAADRIERKLK